MKKREQSSYMAENRNPEILLRKTVNRARLRIFTTIERNAQTAHT